MNKICGIYKITSPTGKIYIGQSANIKSRITNYKNARCKCQQKSLEINSRQKDQSEAPVQ